MKRLDIYVVQNAEEKSCVCVFTSKRDAIEHVKDQLDEYIDDSDIVKWVWNDDGVCVVSMTNPEQNPGRVWESYYLWKDDICLSDEDMKILTSDGKGEPA
jgi:hypothetical protein